MRAQEREREKEENGFVCGVWEVPFGLSNERLYMTWRDECPLDSRGIVKNKENPLCKERHVGYRIFNLLKFA